MNQTNNQPEPEMKIYLVDDDQGIRISLERLLSHNGYQVQVFESGIEFLEKADLTVYGCILLDLAMPNMSGLEVQSELIKRNCKIPLIFMTGHGDVPTSVVAIKRGAVEFLEKPFDVAMMIERVEEAIQIDASRFLLTKKNAEVLANFQTLTPREQEVMAALVAGKADKSNKEIARELELSHRTVEEYRARIFVKMKASSITHLAGLAKICLDN